MTYGQLDVPGKTSRSLWSLGRAIGGKVGRQGGLGDGIKGTHGGPGTRCRGVKLPVAVAAARGLCHEQS